MASSLALRRLAGRNLLSGVLSRPRRSLSVAPSVTRSFNTSTQMVRADDDEHEDRYDRGVSRRRDFPGFFPDVFDPLAPTREREPADEHDGPDDGDPLLSGSMRRGWNVKEDENALQLKVDMPGLSKGDVKVSVEDNTLIIRGEGAKESDEETTARRYTSRIDLTPNAYKIDEIKAEMKNGVLKVTVPKMKEEERKDVFQIQVN